MITNLTQEQIDKFPFYVEKWLKIGLSTEKCDFEKSKKAAKLAYKLAGLKEPKYFFGPFNNPIECAVAQIYVKEVFKKILKESNWSQVESQVRSQIESQAESQVSFRVWFRVSSQVSSQVRSQVRSLVRSQVGSQVRSQVWSQVESQVESQVWLQVESQVRSQVWSQVRSQVWSQVRSQVWSQVESQVWSQVESQVESQVYGSQDSSWLSYYDFMLTELKIKGCKKLQGLFNLAKVCGWWAPFENCVFFQHRPQKIYFNSNKVLHNLNGPAIKFYGPELCNVYCINGVRVNKNIVEKNFTAQDIDKEENVEIRRIMIDLYGQSRYLLDSRAEKVHSDDFGTLYRKKQKNDEDIYMVKVVNSTPEPDGNFKDYFIRVQPSAYGGLKTAMAAVASTWRNRDNSMVFSKPEDYLLAQQT